MTTVTARSAATVGRTEWLRHLARRGWSVQHGGVSLDALVLALASVIRLTSVASVYAMLSAPRPTRLLTAYITAGFVLSAAIGIVLVTVLDASHTGALDRRRMPVNGCTPMTRISARSTDAMISAKWRSASTLTGGRLR